MPLFANLKARRNSGSFRPECLLHFALARRSWQDRIHLRKMSQPKLLGKSENVLPTEPSREILDRFENCRPGRNYWIHLDAPEFSSLCPVTGQPDSSHVVIRYRPNKWCVETKSLKFYLASWRNTAAFNEEVINTILDDLVAVCEPTEMTISGAFGARGGISLTVEVKHPDS